jgi:hypothetical protein
MPQLGFLGSGVLGVMVWYSGFLRRPRGQTVWQALLSVEVGLPSAHT